MTQVLVQFHNLAEGMASAYDRHLQDLARVLAPGLVGLQRYALSAAQFPGSASLTQPYRGMTLFEIDDAVLLSSQASLAERVRAARASGLLAEDRTHLFNLLRNRVLSASPAPPDDPEHLMIVMANYTTGMRDAWGAWYDDVHGPEWLDLPGVDAYSRGVLADAQIDSEGQQPAGGLVIYGLKTANFDATLAEALARATGRSSTGVRWSNRSPAVLNSTTYGFDPVGARYASE